MKRLLLTTVGIIIIILFSVTDLSAGIIFTNFDFQKSSHPNSDTNVVSFLSTVKVKKYYSKPVDSFLLSIPATPDSMRIESCISNRESLFKACYLEVFYAPDIVVRIYVKNFTHLTQYNTNRNWNTSLFRQEDIHKISIYRIPFICINGWCKE